MRNPKTRAHSRTTALAPCFLRWLTNSILCSDQGYFDPSLLVWFTLHNTHVHIVKRFVISSRDKNEASIPGERWRKHLDHLVVATLFQCDPRGDDIYRRGVDRATKNDKGGTKRQKWAQRGSLSEGVEKFATQSYYLPTRPKPLLL